VSGLVDIHCHLLWGLDDGCREPEDTLAAARALASLGYSDVAPSPHAQERYPGGDAAVARARLEEAQRLLAAEGVPIRLHAGAESPLDDRYLRELNRGVRRGLGIPERYALVELPFCEAVPDLPERIAYLRARGVQPILAHPERCLEFEREGRAAEAVERGAALQLNLGSLIGRHGMVARDLAEELLDGGLYAVAGTDLHGALAAADWIDEALTTLEARGGAELLERLCAGNPHRVLAGEALR
jgi:protein-tyrosine phosphatase